MTKSPAEAPINRARSKSLLLSAALSLLLCLALLVRAGLDLAAPASPEAGSPGSPAAGLILTLAAFLAVLWTFFLAKRLAAAPEDSRPVEARPEPVPTVQPAPPPRPAAEGGKAAEDSGAEALMLLSLLQEKGRFVDFVMEDIAGYSNEQVGAVARVVHQGCRTVVQEAFSPQPVTPAENARITLEPGYDAGEFRLAGRAGGEPPFSVKVTHKGWRARHVKLPRRMPAGGGTGTGTAAANPVIVPAEVTV